MTVWRTTTLHAVSSAYSVLTAIDGPWACLPPETSLPPFSSVFLQAPFRFFLGFCFSQVPIITTINGAIATVKAIQGLKEAPVEMKALQDYFFVPAEASQKAVAA